MPNLSCVSHSLQLRTRPAPPSSTMSYCDHWTGKPHGTNLDVPYCLDLSFLVSYQCFYFSWTVSALMESENAVDRVFRVSLNVIDRLHSCCFLSSWWWMFLDQAGDECSVQSSSSFCLAQILFLILFREKREKQKNTQHDEVRWFEGWRDGTSNKSSTLKSTDNQLILLNKKQEENRPIKLLNNLINFGSK